MWTRKELKKSARQRLKVNYWNAVIVCFMLFIFTGAYADSSTIGEITRHLTPDYKISSNAEIVNVTLSGIYKGAEQTGGEREYSPEKNGVLAGVFNNITKSGSFIFGTLNATNQFIFGDKISAGIVILIGSMAAFLYWMFIKNILKIGVSRFYIENKYESNVRVNRIAYIYRTHMTLNAAKIMFLKGLYTALWSLTIIGGVIKFYSYSMIPYIIAENPEVSAKEAFRLSKQMTRNNKWKMFKLDMSFLHWHILSIFSVGIVGFFISNPYTTATEAELYLALREETVEEKIDLSLVMEQHSKQWLTVDYHRYYTIFSLILLFFAFSFIGWVWEVSYTSFTDGVVANRGVLNGPWLPIYGSGGVLLIVLLKKWIDKPVVTFFLAVGVCAIVEYATSWALESIYHIKWWDYSGYVLNLNGRICFEGLLVFGLGGCVMIYFLAPIIDIIIQKVPFKLTVIICVILCIIFVIDVFISLGNPNTGKGITVSLALINI